LVGADLVAEVFDGFVCFFFCFLGILRSVLVDGKHYCNIQSNENIVVGWTGSDWETVHNILFCDKELNLSEWKAPVESTFILNVVELSMSCNDSISSLRSIGRFKLI
jgi:hypothetical protein